MKESDIAGTPRIVNDIMLGVRGLGKLARHAPKVLLRTAEGPSGEERRQIILDRGTDYVVVVLLALHEGEQCLLAKEEFVYGAMQYVLKFASGGIDEDESPEQAAMREVREEFGIRLFLENLTRIGGPFLESPDKLTGSQFLFIGRIPETLDSTGEALSEAEPGRQRYFPLTEEGVGALLPELGIVLQREAVHETLRHLRLSHLAYH